MNGVEDLIGIEFFFRRTELLITFLVILIGLAFGNLKIKGFGFGVICGGMTFTPGLNVIAETDSSERPIVAYSSVYPVALILVIALVQIMYVSIVALQAG